VSSGSASAQGASISSRGGDANTAVERWSVEADGTVGLLTLRIPKLGYAVAVFTIPAVRFAFISLASVVLGGLLIRRIWADPA
jgi:hypothetical protein